jgi:hypothetical protein
MSQNRRDRERNQARKADRRRRRERKRDRRLTIPRNGTPDAGEARWGDPTWRGDEKLAKALIELVRPLTLSAVPGTERPDDEAHFFYVRTGVAKLIWNAYSDAFGDRSLIDEEALCKTLVDDLGLEKDKTPYTVDLLLERRAEKWGNDFRHVGLSFVLTTPDGRSVLQVQAV